MDEKLTIFVVVPAFNEEKIIQEVVVEIKKSGYENIIVVDDGSGDGTFAAAQKAGVAALRHKINRGKGAAVKTGMEAAKKLGADVVVTMDGDGQHDPRDIAPMIRLLGKGYDVILGSRLMDRKGMPLHKVIANRVGNFITWYLYGLWVTDSQSGFRAYSRWALAAIDTRSDRYEYDSEIIREIHRNKLKYIETPIEVRYTEYSTGKLEKQSFLNGLKTVARMVWRIIS